MQASALNPEEHIAVNGLVDALEQLTHQFTHSWLHVLLRKFTWLSSVELANIGLKLEKADYDNHCLSRSHWIFFQMA